MNDQEKAAWDFARQFSAKPGPKETYTQRRKRHLLARKSELERELWAINTELSIDKYPAEEISYVQES